MPRHDSETGVLMRNVEDLPCSASNWKTFLKKKEFHDHPFAYMSCLMAIVGPLGSGKSTLIYNILDELNEIIAEKKLGRVIYYSGSGMDAILENYDKDEVELYDKKSKESFLTALKEIQSESQMTDPDNKLMNIIIIDDAITDADIMPSSVKSQTELSKIMMSCRHIPACVIVTSQKYNALPTFLRSNCSHLFAFRTRAPDELKSIMKDVNFTPKEFEEAMKSLTENNQFVWCQSLNRKLVKGFTESIVR